jgi:hypothetical protein
VVVWPLQWPLIIWTLPECNGIINIAAAFFEAARNSISPCITVVLHPAGGGSACCCAWLDELNNVAWFSYTR